MGYLINPNDNYIRDKIYENLKFVIDNDEYIKNEVNNYMNKIIKFNDEFNLYINKNELRKFIIKKYELFLLENLNEIYEENLINIRNNPDNLYQINNNFKSRYLFDIYLNSTIESYKDIKEILIKFRKKNLNNEYSHYYLNNSIRNLNNSIRNLDDNYKSLNNSIINIKKDIMLIYFLIFIISFNSLFNGF